MVVAAGGNMAGTMLVNGAITLGANASLNGRGLSIDGAIVLNNNAINVPVMVLPVSLLSFNAAIQKQSVLLTWATASETNTSSFTVERSGANSSWAKAGSVTAAGNSTAVTTYSFVDAAPLKGINYYRLRSIDTDGRNKLSGVVNVKFSDAAGMGVYPNPVTDAANITGLPKGVMITVTDISGRRIKSVKTMNTGVNSIPLGELQTGIYFLSAAMPEGKNTVIKIMKQ